MDSEEHMSVLASTVFVMLARKAGLTFKFREMSLTYDKVKEAQ